MVIPDSHLVQGARCHRVARARSDGPITRRRLPEDQYLQNQQLSHPQNTGPPWLCGPDQQRALPAGFVATPPALWVCRLERRVAFLDCPDTNCCLGCSRFRVELVILDNKFDADTAIRNAEKFVAKRVDLVLEFQAE